MYILATIHFWMPLFYMCSVMKIGQWRKETTTKRTQRNGDESQY